MIAASAVDLVYAVYDSVRHHERLGTVMGAQLGDAKEKLYL